MSFKSVTKSIAVAAFLAAASTSASALTLDFTSDHCTGGCGTPPFGTVTLDQSGTTVDVTVSLLNGNSFVQTGAGDEQAFLFNAVGVTLADITVDPHSPALVAETGTFGQGGVGTFGFGINCPSCGNGFAGAFSTDIVFHVADATIADLTIANALGNVFVADIFSAQTGNTGLVDVTAVPGPIVGAGLPSLVLACGGLLALARRRRAAAIPV